MKFFISFKEFASDPIKATLFLALISIGYLYFDNKSILQKQIDKQEKRIEVLEAEVKFLQTRLLETSNLLD